MMQVTETLSDGLKRELKVVIGAQELQARMDARLEEMKGKIHLKGFRPGKAPVAHLRKIYGRSVMGEVLEKAVSETTSETLAARAERPAFQPAISLPEDKTVVEQVLQGKADLEYTMYFEILPKIDLVDLKTLAIDKPVAEIGDEEVETALEKLAKANVSYEKKDEPAADGDRLIIDFTGSLDGAPFEGGSAEDAAVVLGAGQTIPGFSEGLLGARQGEARAVAARFPDDYPAQELAGKEAEFTVTVKEVGAPATPALDDAFAKTLGLQTLAELRDAIRGRMQRDFDGASRAKAKRRLLDALDAAHSFDLPPSLVESEFKSLCKEPGNKDGEGEGDSAPGEAERARLHSLAERRVRLGLILAEIGQRNEIRVTDEDLRRAVWERARQYPGQEKAVVEFYKKNAEAFAELQAPIFEEKVVDFSLELVKINELKVGRDELFEHEHGPECNHDDGQVQEDKPAGAAEGAS